MCHALHNDTEQKDMVVTCNKCQQPNARWHCNTCEDFDLCEMCKSTLPHEHPLEQINSLVDQGKDQTGNSRYESIQRCIASLVHACQCRDANCRRMSCHKMKRVVQHTKMCKKRVNSSCPVCKQLIALCCYHAKHCNRDGCQVPFCMNIRQKLTEQKRSMARRSEMMMRRRMEGLHACVAPPPPAPTNNTPTPQPSQTMNHGPMSAGPSSVNSGIGNPSTPQPNAGQHNMKGGGPMYQMNSNHNQQMGNQHPQQQQQYRQSLMNQQNQGPSNPSNQMGYSGQQQMGGGNANQMGMPGPQNMMRGGGHSMPPSQQQQQPSQQQRGGPPPNMSAYQRGPPMSNNQGGQYGGNMMNQGPPGGMMSQQQNMHNIPPGQPQGMGGRGMGGPNAPPPQGQPGSSQTASDPQLQKIMTRVKAARTQEEKEALFNDLKKTPHLFTAFLKMMNQNNQGAGNVGGMMQGGGGAQNWMGNQQPQGNMQMNAGNGPPQHGNVSQMGGPQQHMQQQQQFYQQHGNNPQSRGPGGQYASMPPQQQWQQQQQFQHRANQGSPAVPPYGNQF